MEKIVGNREPGNVPATAFFICVTLLIFAIIGQTWWSVAQDKRLTLSTTQENNYLTVRILEEHASRTLHDATHALDAASDAILAEGDAARNNEQRLHQILMNERQNFSFIQTISLVNDQGVIWANSTRAVVEKISLLHQPQIKFLLEHPDEKKTLVGSPVMAEEAEQWGIPVSKNVYSSNGKRLGVMQADIRIHYFQDFYERAAKEVGAAISLHDINGFALIRAPFDTQYTNQNNAGVKLDALMASTGIEGTVLDAPMGGRRTNDIYLPKNV